MQIETSLLKKCKPRKGHVLVLKSLAANLKAYGNFQWPEKGKVSAPDWKPIKDCGNGLHGWLWGQGDSDLRCKDNDAKWLVLEVADEPIIELGGKVKFPACTIKYLGDRDTAVGIIQHHAPNSTAVMFSTLTGGDDSTLTGGDDSTLTGGYRSTLTGGDDSTLTGGNGSLLVARKYDYKNQKWVFKAALVDGVTILPGVKYRLNSKLEFEPVNETIA